MKKFLAFLLSAMLLLSFTACAGQKDDDDTASTPTSKPGTSQDGTSGDGGTNQDGTLQPGDNGQGNSQTGKPDNSQPSTPPVDPDPTDLTIYVPYSTDIDEEKPQYYPPTLGDDGSISPGVSVQGTQFETPELFDVKKAITALKNEVPSITTAKLQEYVSKYANAYNKHYTQSNYKLVVSFSGNTVKYTYTVTGKPAERKSYVIEALLDAHFDKYFDFYSDFYKAQISNYKQAMPNISNIEICIIRADNDPLLDNDNYTKNIMSKTFS